MTTNETSLNDVIVNPLIISSLQKNLSIVTSVHDNKFDESVKNIVVTVIDGTLIGRTYHIKVPSNTPVKVGEMVKILIEKATPYASSNQRDNSFIPIRISLKGKILKQKDDE